MATVVIIRGSIAGHAVAGDRIRTDPAASSPHDLTFGQVAGATDPVSWRRLADS
jgi:hypothetical protein